MMKLSGREVRAQQGAPNQSMQPIGGLLGLFDPILTPYKRNSGKTKTLKIAVRVKKSCWRLSRIASGMGSAPRY